MVRRTISRLIKASVKLAVAVLLLAYIAVTFVHLTNGLSLGSSLVAGFQDARLGITCPTNLERQWEFIDRTKIEHLSFIAALDQGKHAYEEICAGDRSPPQGWIALAQELKKDLGADQPADPLSRSMNERTPSPITVFDSRPSPTKFIVKVPTPKRVQPNRVPSVPSNAKLQNSRWQNEIGDLEKAIAREINSYRVSLGLSALTFDNKIADQARQHLEKMAKFYAIKGELVHSDELTLSDPFLGTGFGCGENVLSRPRSTSETLMYGVVISRQEDLHNMAAWDLAELLVAQWTDSPGHEANMRGAQYTHTVGLVSSTI